MCEARASKNLKQNKHQQCAKHEPKKILIKHTFAMCKARAYIFCTKQKKIKTKIFPSGERIQKCSDFASVRRFGKTDAMAWNVSIYEPPTILSSSKKPKKPKFVGTTKLTRTHLYSVLTAQGDKNCHSCCFRRWQAVRRYCKAAKTKRFTQFIKATMPIFRTPPS